MLVFISGPYRNQSDPHTAFNDAARRIWRLGAVPFNPIEEGAVAADILDDDAFIGRYCDVIDAGYFDAIYFLPGAWGSVGSKGEFISACYAGCALLQYWWSDDEIRQALQKGGVITATQHAMEGRR